MRLLREFKAFAMRGSVMDLAVGVVIGAAFGKIVSSFVENVIMPPLGLAVGGVSFTQLKLILRHAAAGQPEVAIGYGAFVQAVFDFLIIALCIFLMIKGINRLVSPPKPETPQAPPPPPDVQLLSEIRDILKKQAEV